MKWQGGQHVNLKLPHHSTDMRIDNMQKGDRHRKIDYQDSIREKMGFLTKVMAVFSLPNIGVKVYIYFKVSEGLDQPTQ